jgi:hypothetical protein
MTPQEYFDLLEKHDWAFHYTEDQQIWRKGKAEQDVLLSYTKGKLYDRMYNDYLNYAMGKVDGDNKPTLSDYLPDDHNVKQAIKEVLEKMYERDKLYNTSYCRECGYENRYHKDGCPVGIVEKYVK